MLGSAGSKKLFMLAPVTHSPEGLCSIAVHNQVFTLCVALMHEQDREGVHMIKIADPPAVDRVVSVENFYILSTCASCCCCWCLYIYEPALAIASTPP